MVDTVVALKMIEGSAAELWNDLRALATKTREAPGRNQFYT